MSTSILNPQSAIRSLTILCLLTVAPAQSQGEAQKPGAGLEGIKRAFYQEDYSGAASLAEQYLKKYTGSTKARILLARSEMAQGKYEPAYKHLKEAVAAEPGNVDALYYLGVVAGILSQSEYERLYTLAPESARVHQLLARSEMAQSKYELAYKHLKEAVAAEPGNVDALYYLGVVSGILSQSEYERLYSLAPESARVHQLLAESYQVQENTAEAEREYRAALAANSQSAEVLVALGDIKRLQSDFDEAAKLYSGALDIEPRNYDGIYGLGVCYSYKQDHQRAMEYFRRALNIQPDSAPARLALGFSLTRMRRWEAATKELLAAVALEPKMRQAYYLLGQSYQRLGRSQEAQESFKKAEELSRHEGEVAQDILGSEDVILSAAPPTPKNRSGQKAGQDRKKP